MRGSEEVPGIGVHGNRMGTSCVTNENALRTPPWWLTIGFRVSV